MLEIRNLHLSKPGQIIFNGLALQVAAGEIVTVMGVSGSGKSTLLNWMIGDLAPMFTASGELWLNGSRRDNLPIEQRRIGILFQDDLLFPHLSVGQQVDQHARAVQKGRKLIRSGKALYARIILAAAAPAAQRESPRGERFGHF